MKIGKLNVRVANTAVIGDHFEIKVTNTDTLELFKYDPNTDTVKLRISLETALQLAQFIDEEFDQIISDEMGTSV